MNSKELLPALPPLAPDANKYSRGKLTLVMGSSRYPGSALLAARAAERTGAGYTELVTSKAVMPLAVGTTPSLVVTDRKSWNSRLLNKAGHHPEALALGSGFKGSSFEEDLTFDILGSCVYPVLIDGTALGFLAAKRFQKVLAWRKRKNYATVLTPHGGEAARLALGLGLPEVAPELLAARLARTCEAVVALKGPVTYVSDGTALYLMDQGTPALAKAGTGDVLAGIIGSLLAQAMGPYEAAIAGTSIHADAGRLAAEAKYERSVIAEDLIDFLPAALASYEKALV